ncbi:hypothetical protein VP01_2236g2 [Puccinia sorghi]|uniref:Uncharacterized protein n=1 Tax=Puccinia sorghi TaxID=27349 RepID=A0A0L6VAH1_9BASI|nr:hypothetical protein VP01_2236g2 [Puccinia sorghi]
MLNVETNIETLLAAEREHSAKAVAHWFSTKAKWMSKLLMQLETHYWWQAGRGFPSWRVMLLKWLESKKKLPRKYKKGTHLCSRLFPACLLQEACLLKCSADLFQNSLRFVELAWILDLGRNSGKSYFFRKRGVSSDNNHIQILFYDHIIPFYNSGQDHFYIYSFALLPSYTLRNKCIAHFHSFSASRNWSHCACCVFQSYHYHPMFSHSALGSFVYFLNVRFSPVFPLRRLKDFGLIAAMEKTMRHGWYPDQLSPERPGGNHECSLDDCITHCIVFSFRARCSLGWRGDQRITACHEPCAPPAASIQVSSSEHTSIHHSSTITVSAFFAKQLDRKKATPWFPSCTSLPCCQFLCR